MSSTFFWLPAISLLHGVIIQRSFSRATPFSRWLLSSHESFALGGQEMVSQVSRAKGCFKVLLNQDPLAPPTGMSLSRPAGATDLLKSHHSCKSYHFGESLASFWALGPSRVKSGIKAAQLFPFVARKNMEISEFCSDIRNIWFINQLRLGGLSDQSVIHLLKIHANITAAGLKKGIIFLREFPWFNKCKMCQGANLSQSIRKLSM